MVGRIVKSEHPDRIHRFYFLRQLFCRIIFDICYHNLRGPIGRELFFHQIQTDARFRRIRQISGQFVLHLNPVPRESRKNYQNDVN